MNSKILILIALVLIIFLIGCPTPPEPFCGNAVCEAPEETSENCPEDCLVPPPEKPSNTSVVVATTKNNYFIGETVNLTGPIAEKTTPHVGEVIEVEFVPGQFIVKFKGNVLSLPMQKMKSAIADVAVIESTISTLNEKYAVEEVESIFKESDGIFSNIYKFTVPIETNILSLVQDYIENPFVEYAEPNYLAETYFTPNDSFFAEQWSHKRIQSKIGWDTELGNEEIVIAVIDSGVDIEHPDLKANIWINDAEIAGNGIDDEGNGYIDDVKGWDFVDINLDDYKYLEGIEFPQEEDIIEQDNDPSDYLGHGTHCAGIAAAVTNNQEGIAGVCPNCSIMALRAGFGYILDGHINGSLEYDDISAAIKYAADKNANVISMSFGGSSGSMMNEVLDYAYDKGIVLVAAAGNADTNQNSYPAAFPNVIAVSATDKEDKRTSYSNFGRWVDVAAPGGERGGSNAILSTVPTGGFLLESYPGIDVLEGKYGHLPGTSMATPHVAGLAGLILSKNPDYNPEKVKSIIISGSDLTDSRYVGVKRRINVYKAIEEKLFNPYSQIVNLGETTIEGYLVMKVEKLVDSEWVLEKLVIDEETARIIEIERELNLEDMWISSGGFEPTEAGDYRIVVSFNDANGEPIVTEERTTLTDNYRFVVER